MVQNSGKTLCPGAFKSVNLPAPLNVEESASGLPTSISCLEKGGLRETFPSPVAQASPPVIKPGKKQAVTAVEDCWRIDDEWWRSEPVSRLYYAVRFAAGQRLVIYKDLISGRWYRQEY